RAHRGTAYARHCTRWHWLCARDDGGVLRSHREGEPDPRGARRRDGPDPARLDFWVLPALAEILALPRRDAVGRAEADALICAFADRAAPALADRRTDQGAGTRDHRGADRLPKGSKAPRCDDPAGRAEFSRRAGDW